MNKKILGISVGLLVVAMLATPLMVSAKPVVWSVESFSLTTLPDLLGDWSKFKMVETKSGPILVDHIPTIGPVELVYDDGVSEHTLIGEVKQMVLTSKLYLNDDPARVMGNEKWTFTFADAEASTLEVSANFWIDDMFAAEPNGGGTCVGTNGTGVFEGAKFKGTFDTIMISLDGAILKTQYGSGEIKFP
jgi:hypothetical protein